MIVMRNGMVPERVIMVFVPNVNPNVLIGERRVFPFLLSRLVSLQGKPFKAIEHKGADYAWIHKPQGPLSAR